MTKKLSDYKSDLLILLGDASGRRYSDDILKMALRQALATFGEYWPNKYSIEADISSYEGSLAVLATSPDAGTVILTVQRKSTGEWLDFADYRTGANTYIALYGQKIRPEVGETLVLGLAIPHTIKDLDLKTDTTVPDIYSGIVETGAAAEAVRIRARSVTEVFGKRPEDVERLDLHAKALEEEFYRQLGGLLDSPIDPYPRGGFPV